MYVIPNREVNRSVAIADRRRRVAKRRALPASAAILRAYPAVRRARRASRRFGARAEVPRRRRASRIKSWCEASARCAEFLLEANGARWRRPPRTARPSAVRAARLQSRAQRRRAAVLRLKVHADSATDNAPGRARRVAAVRRRVHRCASGPSSKETARPRYFAQRSYGRTDPRLE